MIAPAVPILAIAPPASRRARPPLRLVVNRACAAGEGGVCLACDARPGEPCRNPGLRANDN